MRYVSPSGNYEEWDEKPDGYYTVEEWEAAHPAPTPPSPTKDELIEALNFSYASEKSDLCITYTAAQMQGDTETAASVAQDLADLDAWYDEEYERIVGGD